MVYYTHALYDVTYPIKILILVINDLKQKPLKPIFTYKIVNQK